MGFEITPTEIERRNWHSMNLTVSKQVCRSHLEGRLQEELTGRRILGSMTDLRLKLSHRATEGKWNNAF